MKTTIKKILAEDILATYVNGFSPTYNIVSHVLISRGQSSQLTNEQFRNELEASLAITETISRNGDKIAFSETEHLFARQTK